MAKRKESDLERYLSRKARHEARVLGTLLSASCEIAHAALQVAERDAELRHAVRQREIESGHELALLRHEHDNQRFELERLRLQNEQIRLQRPSLGDVLQRVSQSELDRQCKVCGTLKPPEDGGLCPECRTVRPAVARFE